MQIYIIRTMGRIKKKISIENYFEIISKLLILNIESKTNVGSRNYSTFYLSPKL